MAIRNSGLRDFDWPMVFVVIIICSLGVLQIFSATHDTIWQGSWWKQIFYIATGFGLMWGTARLDYHSLIARAYPAYIASVVLLLAVLLIGKTAFHSTRWIALPLGVHLQVSEFAKFVVILLVARYLIDRRSDVLELSEFLKLAGLIVVPMTFATMSLSKAFLLFCRARRTARTGGPES